MPQAPSLEIPMQCLNRGDKESHEAGTLGKLDLFKLRSARLNPEICGLVCLLPMQIGTKSFLVETWDMGMKDKGKRLRGEYAHHWFVGRVLRSLARAVSLTTLDFVSKKSSLQMSIRPRCGFISAIGKVASKHAVGIDGNIPR
jgi:hypothetical protein